MSITPDIIETIKEACQVEEVIGDFVSLRKKGHYYMACCPFHNEKTPSFTVTPAKGIYKCFGCGKAGDSIQFVMEIEGLNYPEALKYLAGKYGIEVKEDITPESIAEQSEKESLHIVLNYASKYYENLLWESEEGKSIGISYFKERGYSQKTIKEFALGYSSEKWDGLVQEALKDGYSKEYLIKAGLILESDESKGYKHKLYDRFRGRVIFPIHNLTGKVIAFGARILKTDKKQPKYLNSPETEVYHKSKVLYGLYQAKQAIRHKDNCFLVEGYTDVISLFQEGIENVVSSSGTSLTIDQIKLINRYTNNVTVLYDGDAAGIKASIRGIDLILSEGLNVTVVTFPEGEDPDSFVKKVGGEGFHKHIEEHSRDFITFKTEVSLKEAGKDPVKKAEVIRDIVDSISKIPDSIKRAVFFQQCSQLLQIDEDVLISEYNKKQLNQRNKKEEFVPAEESFEYAINTELKKKDSRVSAVEAQEKEIVRLLLKYGNEQVDTTNFATYVLAEIEDTEFTIPIYKTILDIIKDDIRDLGIVRDQQFFSHPEEEIRSVAIELITSRYAISEQWVKHEIFVPTDLDILPQIAFNSIIRLKFRSLKFMIKENMDLLQKAEKNGEDIISYLQVHKQLKEAEKELAKILGIVISG